MSILRNAGWYCAASWASKMLVAEITAVSSWDSVWRGMSESANVPSQSVHFHGFSADEVPGWRRAVGVLQVGHNIIRQSSGD